jgi:hypothetical protein
MSESINDIMRRLYKISQESPHLLGSDIRELLDYATQLEFDLDVAKAKLNGSWPNYDQHKEGYLTVTWSGDQIALVSRQDEDHRILKIIAESGKPPTESNCYE